jgi:DNA-binding LacI/PurR family transcriptional regulator
MSITLNDIAKVVGVRKSTVSMVLNNKTGAIEISTQTRDQIHRVARELGYHPNAAARALTRGRTGHLGFILSDTVTDGWANPYFADCLAGVESACRQAGYGLMVSRYNLTNIDSFVFPSRIGMRSVDGLVLTGYVRQAVLKKFQEFGIPCVCVGEDVEVAGQVMTVAADVSKGFVQVVRHARGMGHRRIGFWLGDSREAMDVLEAVERRVSASPDLADCRLVRMTPVVQPDEYRTGASLFVHWRKIPAAERPTAIFTNEHAIHAFLKELSRAAMSCPRDVSLICGSDSRACEFTNPSLTAVRIEMQQMGRIAVGALVDHLDRGAAIGPETSMNRIECEVISRESCAPPAAP